MTPSAGIFARRPLRSALACRLYAAGYWTGWHQIAVNLILLNALTWLTKPTMACLWLLARVPSRKIVMHGGVYWWKV
jgi:hypothetical protein